MQTSFQTKFKLRDYQERAVRDILKREQYKAHLYAGPTGCGKSIVELEALSQMPNSLLVTPRLEIIAGMLDKQGVDCSSFSDQKLAETAFDYRITTPVRLRNKLAKGELEFLPDQIIIDEAHHSIADTYQDITAFLPGRTIFGLTATPYRGTPRSTKDFYDLWNNEVTWIITLQKAAQRGIISVPKVEIWPLIDDDLIKVVNGEFQTESIGDVTRPHLKVVAERCRAFLTDSGWDMPTLFAVPSTDLVVDLVDRLNEAGCPAVGVTQKTTRADRNKAFADCIARRVAVVQIDVVSEGVDLPIRRLIDLRATMSPVRWIQQVGRITRPGGVSYYIVCNRNLERHAYLMDGLIPSSKIAEGQKAFPVPTTRAVTRAIGLEGIGRFSPAEVQLADGCVGQLYSMYSNDEFKKTEWAVLLHPAVPNPLVAFKENAKTDDGRVDYKKRWQRVDTLPSDLRGFASSPPGYLSEKQQTWWNKSAYYRGIDTTSKATRKNFQALAVLENTNTFFRVGGW